MQMNSSPPHLPWHLKTMTAFAPHLLVHLHLVPRLLLPAPRRRPSQRPRHKPTATKVNTRRDATLRLLVSLTAKRAGELGFSAAVSVEYEVAQESPVIVPLAASSSVEATLSRLDVGAVPAAEPSAHLQSPPATSFDLEGVRSREAHRLRAVEEDRCGALRGA
jgi:hypothetical protein